MADSNKISFKIIFFRALLITLGIQIVFLMISMIKERYVYSSSMTERFNFWEITFFIAFYSKIFMIGCIISIAVNIFLAVKSKLEIWQKVILSIFLPSNFTYLIILPLGVWYGFMYFLTLMAKAELR